MKKRNSLHTVTYTLLLSAPIFLSGCESMQDFFGDSSTPRYSEYEHNNMPAAKSPTSKQHIIRKTEVTATSLADPGTSSVTMPKTTKATVTTTQSATVTQDGPAVPNMAPTVGQ